MKTTPFDLTEIEADLIANFRNNKRIQRKRTLGYAVQIAVKPTYFDSPQETVCQVLTDAINVNGFIAPDFSAVGSSSQGSQNYDLGQDCYLCVSWYQMQSGRFEIVAYVS